MEFMVICFTRTTGHAWVTVVLIGVKRMYDSWLLTTVANVATIVLDDSGPQPFLHQGPGISGYCGPVIQRHQLRIIDFSKSNTF